MRKIMGLVNVMLKDISSVTAKFDFIYGKFAFKVLSFLTRMKQSGLTEEWNKMRNFYFYNSDRNFSSKIVPEEVFIKLNNLTILFILAAIIFIIALVILSFESRQFFPLNYLTSQSF
jgi:hypothetical protein